MTAPSDRNPTLEIGDDRSFRLLVEAIPDYPICMLDARGIIRTWNHAAEQTCGYTAGEIIGQHHAVLFSTEDRKRNTPDALLQRAVEEGHVEDNGYRVRRDGSLFRTQVTVSQIRDAEGLLTGFGLIIRDTTRYQQAEAERLAGAERVRAIVETVPDAVITINARGTIESFNPAAMKMFGYQAEEVIGQNIKIMMPSPYHEEHDSYLENYIRTGDAKIIGIGREVTALKKDGTNFPIELAVGEFEVGGKKFFAGVIRDISERKRSEELQYEAAQRIRAIVDTVPDGIITINARGIIEAFNPAAEKMFGFESSEVMGKNVKVLMPEPYHSEHDSYLQNYMRTGDAKIIGIGREVTALKKDGTSFPIELAVGEFKVAEEKFFAGVIRDISERKDAERRQQEATERIRAIVETVPDGIITIDEEARVETFNLAAEKLFGFSASEVIGNNVKMLMPQPYHGEHDDYLRSYHDTGDAKIIGIGREVMAQRKDGSVFPIELAVGEIQLGDRRMYAGVVRDITERKLAEDSMRYLNEVLEKRVRERTEAMRELQLAMRQLQEAQNQLVQTEKLASLGSLVAGVAHEINTPVGIGVTAASHLQEITGNLEQAFKENRMKRSELREYIDNSTQSTGIILNNLRRAAELIHSFKQVAVDQSSAERRTFNLATYIDEVLLSLRPQLRQSHHQLVVDCPAHLELDTFPGALAQIITNLVINANTHAFAEGEHGTISIEVEERDEHLVLHFRDNGRGIAPDCIDKVFDPFYTSRRGQGGSGLGLHIVYNLATQTLEGSIKVESTVGKGSDFQLTLPR